MTLNPPDTGGGMLHLGLAGYPGLLEKCFMKTDSVGLLELSEP